VDAFEGTSERKRVADLSTASFRCREAKNRSQPFAAREKTVAHSSVQGRGFRIRFWQVAIKCALDQFLARDEIRFDVHGSARSMWIRDVARGDYLASSSENPALSVG
jgi:hypothetical protein